MSILDLKVMVFPRLTVLVLSLVLIAGNLALCAGWAATPQARMACCSEGNDCPMHKGESQISGSQRVMTQAQADSCCASSESQTSTQSSAAFTAVISSAVLGTTTVLPQIVPALVLRDGWRTDSPIPTTLVPKHLLLSVFLV